VWFRALGFPSGLLPLVEKYNEQVDGGWALFYHTSLGLRFEGSVYQPVNSPCWPGIKVGQWHNITLAYSRTSEEYRIYFDGTLICGGSSVSEIASTNGGDLLFGYSPAGGDEWTHADLDGIAIWNRALSGSEIADIYDGAVTPDEIVFQRGVGLEDPSNASQEIWVMRPDGSGEQRLTSNAFTDAYPMLSPDKKQVVFASDRDRDVTQLGVFVMNRDGSGVEPLSTNRGLNATPRWSPDGSSIAYSTTGDRQDWGSYPAWPVIMRADGSGKTGVNTQVTYTQGLPTWSLDAQSLFVTDREFGQGEIQRISRDGTIRTRLTFAAGDDWLDGHALSPDGKQLLFSSQRDGNVEIYVMNVDGSNQTRLTNNAARDEQPAWSPDGTRIVFSSRRSGRPQLYIMNADGTNVVRLTNSESNDFHPHWR
jgi:TolB protein